MLTVLDLFSGIGGFSLGLERTGGFKTIAFCEIDPFCRRVLNKHWPEVHIYEDVQKLTLPAGFADVICGGFPCQDISNAGKGAGIEGERSGLWKEYARIIGEVRPRYVLVENVAALLGRGLGRVLGDLAALGYDAEWHCIPASAVGAPHRRDRVWIVAYSGQGSVRPWRIGGMPEIKPDDWQGFLHASRSRDDYEISYWVDRVGALGNAVVPQIPEILGREILKAEAA
jgi:DNA (cytosine-5)-methyltransferase 1